VTHRSFPLGVEVKCSPSWLQAAVGTVVSSAPVPVVLPGCRGHRISPGDPGLCGFCSGRGFSCKLGLEQGLGSRELMTEEPTELCKHPADALPPRPLPISGANLNCCESNDLPHRLSNPCCSPTPLKSQVLFLKF